MIAAANNLPEGAPVGTIARRPDGAWIARKEQCGKWGYRPFTNEGEWPQPDDADSWPQIRPDQWPDQAGLDWFKPGEEPLVPRPGPTASNTDAAPMSEPKGEMFGIILETLDSVKFYGVDAPYLALQVHNALRAAGYDADPTDHPSREELRGYFHKDLAEHCQAGESLARGLDDIAAGRVSRRDDYLEPQQEPQVEGNLSEIPKSSTQPRTPRVVDRLGVDEQGSRWRDENGLIHSFTEGADGGRWKTQIGGSWYPWAKGVVPHGGEYTEIVEPRVLPSLDCEEARDGTVWRAAFSQTDHGRGWKFWYVAAEREWYTDAGHDGSSPLRVLDFLTERGPYTEVIGDPS